MKKVWTGERLEKGIHGQVAIEHLHRYAFAMEYAKDKQVLDIACGDGYGSRLLAEKATWVTGVDIDQEVINLAKKKYKADNLQFKQGDITQIPFNVETFDLVVCFETLEHSSKHNELLSEIKRVLKKGGQLIISTPDKKWYTDQTGSSNLFHEKELYKEEFISLLKNHFEYVTLLEQKYFSGSLLLPSENYDQTKCYRGSFETITDTNEMEAVYMVALASDNILPLPDLSLFSGEDVMEAALMKKEADIRSTLTYRTGEFLLAPFKWIKKRFS